MSDEIKSSAPLPDPQPQRPAEPDPEDCCGEGCVRCVYDIHDAKVERFETRLAAWHERHPEAE